MSAMVEVFPICPRCLGPIPTAASPGAYPGAASRATDDRDIEICSPCGSDEAMRQARHGYVLPVATWPLPVAHAHLFDTDFPGGAS